MDESRNPEGPGNEGNGPAYLNPEEVSQAFGRMFWAFLFLGVMVGPIVHLGREHFFIDVLPDCLGFWILASGANLLAPVFPKARTLRRWALLASYLSVPATVRYMVDPPYAEHPAPWVEYLGWLWVAVWLVGLVVVWRVCGLVVDVARAVRDPETESSARFRLGAYVVLHVGLALGTAAIQTSPTRAASPAVLVAIVVAGLAGMSLMMGIMRRARRLLEEDVLVVEEILARTPARTVRGWLDRAIALGGVLLPVVGAIGAYVYYVGWDNDRRQMYSGNDRELPSAYDSFCRSLWAHRDDEAYALTTAEFRRRVGREAFSRLASAYRDFRLQLSLSDPYHGADAEGGSSGGESESGYHYREVSPGVIYGIVHSVRREDDSLFRMEPPLARVDRFDVVQAASVQEVQRMLEIAHR